MTKRETDPIEEAERDAAMARDVIAGLHEQRREIEQAGPARQSEMAALSYRALAEGDKAASARLQTLHREAAEDGSRLAAVDMAIAEGERRLAHAEQRINAAAERQRIDQVLAHAERLEQLTGKIDGMVAELVAVVGAVTATHREIVRLGAENPTTLTLHSFLARAFNSGTLGSPLNSEFIAGPARVTFAGLGQNWRRLYQVWGQRQLAVIGGAEPAEAVELEQEAAE